MTIEKLQSIALRIGNQRFVRHYLWLNYPERPQLMGIEIQTHRKPNARRKARTCECGQCKTCKHRDYMNANRPHVDGSTGRLFKELKDLGFEQRTDGIWVIIRSDS